jgi:hypothetical protein
MGSLPLLPVYKSSGDVYRSTCWLARACITGVRRLGSAIVSSAPAATCSDQSHSRITVCRRIWKSVEFPIGHEHIRNNKRGTVHTSSRCAVCVRDFNAVERAGAFSEWERIAAPSVEMGRTAAGRCRM